MGGSQSALDSFLVLRGTKTLHVRMARHAENALAVARYLETRADVRTVLYPGLPSHPQHALAKRQMSGFGGMVSFVLAGDGAPQGRTGSSDVGDGSALERARRFLRALRVFACAESLGGVESLAESPPLMTHTSIPPERRAAIGIADGLIRLSVGIEHADDLIGDLDQAFAQSAKAAG
jgi:cystathionine gamma-lyase